MLDDKSRLLTTFATPFGRYRWKRLPFGPSTSSEIFQKRGSQALEGLEGILNITDDILIYGVSDTKDEARRDHDLKLEALLLRCPERGIALDKNKLKLRITKVPFMGHLKSPSHLKSHGSPKEPESRLHLLVPLTRSRAHGCSRHNKDRPSFISC